MKTQGVTARLVLVSALLAGVLSLAGCATADPDPFGTANRRSIAPAPAGMPNSGIGAPGGASEDTRSIGTTAESEGEVTGAPPAVGVGASSAPVR